MTATEHKFATAPTRLPGYTLAIAVGLAGILAGVAAIGLGIHTISSIRFQRVVVPGTGRIEIPEPGTYKIFHEYRTVHEDKVYSQGEAGLSGVEIRLRWADSEEPVAVEPSTGSASYSFAETAAEQILRFRAERAGTLVLEGADARAGEPAPAVLAVGRLPIVRIVALLLAGLGGLGLGVAAVVGLAIWTHVRRRRLLEAGRFESTDPSPPDNPYARNPEKEPS